MKLYRVEISQDHPDYTFDEYKDTFDVLAREPEPAIRKARRLARRNGFHPRRTLTVRSVVTLSECVR